MRCNGILGGQSGMILLEAKAVMHANARGSGGMPPRKI